MNNTNYESLPAVLNANQLATTLGISRAGAYQLLNSGSFPTLHIRANARPISRSLHGERGLKSR